MMRDLPAQAFAACFFLTMILLAVPVVVCMLLMEGWRELRFHLRQKSMSELPRFQHDRKQRQ